MDFLGGFVAPSRVLPEALFGLEIPPRPPREELSMATSPSLSGLAPRLLAIPPREEPAFDFLLATMVAASFGGTSEQDGIQAESLKK